MTHPGDDQLAAYAMGEADAAEIAPIELHLVECARCRQELAALRRLLDASADVEMPFRDDGYGARVWAKLEPQLPHATRRMRTASWRSWPLAAAAVFLIAIVQCHPGGHTGTWLHAQIKLILVQRLAARARRLEVQHGLHRVRLAAQ